MTMEQLVVIGVPPAALVVLAGMLVLYASPADKAGQRFLLYLLAVGALLSFAVFIAVQLTPEQDNRPGAQVSAFLSPTLIGVLALIVTNLKSLRGTRPWVKVTALLLGLGFLALLPFTWSGAYVGSPLILAGALVLAIVWALARSSGALVAVVSALTLAGLALLNQDTLYSTTALPDWLRLPFAVLMSVLPGAVVPLAAVLFSTGLQRLPQPQKINQGISALRPWAPVLLRLGLALLLLGYYVYTIVWLSIWDQTSDGLGGVWLSTQAQLVSVGAGMFMVMSTTGKRRAAGAIFAVLVPLLVTQANRWGWDVSYHALTEERAAHIRSAVESYHARNGRYPEALGELVPRDLLFGLPETAEGQRRMTVHFLDTTVGRVCHANVSFPLEPEMVEPGLRARHAWLPSGRLLLIMRPGEVVTLAPCEASVEDLSGHYTDAFSRVAASDRSGNHLLLRSETAYWVVDGATLQARQTAVRPNEYEFHWDRYAFSPSGERLAIARLNGRDSTGGSTLYLLTAGAGDLVQSLSLDVASDQSAPMVEWLTNDELLLHGPGALNIVDFRSDPPTIRNVLRDIFNLDIAYPNDISAMMSCGDRAGKGYHVAVRVNHPRDKALYLYHAETGSSETLHPEGHALLICPDGQRGDLQQREDNPTYRDEYELIWVDAPGKPVSHFAVQGHTPRNYPMLHVTYLPVSDQLAFGSSQGVSLNALPGGETLAFWTLGGGISTYLLVPTDGNALVAVVDRIGLYYLPLPSPSP
ncbi:MAG: hypothetical protein M1546_08000 [Chloroflexi bacterium]|nr:hypothetical protein [Chloroflexota bacterium]